MARAAGARRCHNGLGRGMIIQDDEREEGKVTYDTLVRLANSCEREAARGRALVPIPSDLNNEDLRTIADILRKLASTIRPEMGRASVIRGTA